MANAARNTAKARAARLMQCPEYSCNAANGAPARAAFPKSGASALHKSKKRLKMMLRQTVVLQRRTAKLFNDASKALHKRIHIFRLCLIHPYYVRCCFMAPIRPFISCRAQVPCVHKSFKTVSQLLENPYLYFCLANAGSPSQFACYPKAVRTGAPPKMKHRTPPPCVRPGSPPGLKFSLRPARPNGPFPFPGDETKAILCNDHPP